MVTTGNSQEIIANFNSKVQALDSVIKNGFAGNADAIAIELHRRATINAPKLGDSIEDNEADFKALIDDALAKDSVLKLFVKNATISEIATHLVTKTLKLYSVNDKMYEFKAGVLNGLIRRAEDNLVARTVRLNR